MPYTRKLSPYGSRSDTGRDFVINMFQEDILKMGRWVLKHPHNETGGDLFGLWTAADHGNNLEPIIHVVLGPGSDCRRTSTSFFQSIPYLKKVGYLLTQKYMLGHIGEWHSHHQLGLFEPSGGDSNTVVNNFPRGAIGFILIIVNIVSHQEVKISPYLYSENSRQYQRGQVHILQGKSPFRRTSDIVRAISEGAETEDEATRYGDREVAMDIDRGSWHRRSRSPTRPALNKRLVSETIARIGHDNRQERNASERFPAQYPSATTFGNSRSRSPLGRNHLYTDEVTNTTSGHDRHQRRRTTSPSARPTLGERSPSPTRGSQSSSSDIDESTKTTTRHDEDTSVLPPQDEAAADGKSQLSSPNNISGPMGYAESTEDKTSDETSAQTHATLYSTGGNGRSALRAGEIEKSPLVADKSTRISTTYERQYQDPRITAHAFHLPVSLSPRKETLPPILSPISTAFGRVQQSQSIALAKGHPSQSPCPTRQIPTQSTDVQLCTMEEQWYETEEGKNRLKEIFDGLENEQEVEADRPKGTKDLSINFKCHQRKWVIKFPRDFPQSDIILKGPHFKEEVEVNGGSLSMTNLTKNISHIVRYHCPVCPKHWPSRSSKSGAGTRSRSLHLRPSVNSRASSNDDKSNMLQRPPWR